MSFHIFRRPLRWWNRRFRTTVRPRPYNPHGGRILTTEEWEAMGGFHGALVPGWEVGRPDWWRRGAWSSVTDETVEAARAALDEWQDDMARRAGGRNG